MEERREREGERGGRQEKWLLLNNKKDKDGHWTFSTFTLPFSDHFFKWLPDSVFFLHFNSLVHVFSSFSNFFLLPRQSNRPGHETHQDERESEGKGVISSRWWKQNCSCYFLSLLLSFFTLSLFLSRSPFFISPILASLIHVLHASSFLFLKQLSIRSIFSISTNLFNPDLKHFLHSSLSSRS